MPKSKGYVFPFKAAMEQAMWLAEYNPDRTLRQILIIFSRPEEETKDVR